MLTKIKSFLSVLWAQLTDIWNRSKIFLLGLVLALAYLKWDKIKEALATLAAQQEMKKDNKEDQALANTENSDNNKADILIQQANNLPNKDKPVQPDWYKNQK